MNITLYDAFGTLMTVHIPGFHLGSGWAVGPRAWDTTEHGCVFSPEAWEKLTRCRSRTLSHRGTWVFPIDVTGMDTLAHIATCVYRATRDPVLALDGLWANRQLSILSNRLANLGFWRSIKW